MGSTSRRRPPPAAGFDVQEAQRILGVPETGKWDQASTTAVQAYQRAASLPATGDLDAATWKALHQ